jgi:hypothetical protein
VTASNPPERNVSYGTVRFRIRLDAYHYVTVRVYETLREMHRASKELHGEPCHPTEAANTIIFPDAPGGCIAAMLFTWKFSPAYLIVHESVHAGVACVVKLGPGLGPDEDEPLAHFSEKIFRAIFRRLHA